MSINLRSSSLDDGRPGPPTTLSSRGTENLSILSRWSIFTTASTIAAVGTYMYVRHRSPKPLSLTSYLTKQKNTLLILYGSAGPFIRWIVHKLQPRSLLRGRMKRGILLSLILLWLSLKYQQYLRRAFRRFVRGNPTPSDALTDYPGSDEDLAATTTGTGSSLRVHPSSSSSSSSPPSLASSSAQNSQLSTHIDDPYAHATGITDHPSFAPPPPFYPRPPSSFHSSLDPRASSESSSRPYPGTTLSRSHSNPSLLTRYRADSKDIMDKENLAMILASSSLSSSSLRNKNSIPPNNSSTIRQLPSWLVSTMTNNNVRSVTVNTTAIGNTNTNDNSIGLSIDNNDQSQPPKPGTTVSSSKIIETDPYYSSSIDTPSPLLPSSSTVNNTTGTQLPSSPDESNPTASITMEPSTTTQETKDTNDHDNGNTVISSKEMNDLLYFFRIMRNILQGAQTNAILDLYPLMERIEVPKGEVLFRQNDDSTDGMYIILHGSIGVYNNGSIAIPSHPATMLSDTSNKNHTSSSPLLRSQSVKFERTEHNGTVSSVATNPPSSLPPKTVPSSSSSSSMEVGPLLGIFRTGQTIGENTLLASSYLFSSFLRSEYAMGTMDTGSTDNTATAATDTTKILSSSSSSVFTAVLRPVTAIAIEDSIVLRLTRENFAKFTFLHPNAVVSFILTTTARQFRVAYFTLVDFLHLSEAWRISIEPPGYYPAFRWTDDDYQTETLDTMYQPLTIPNGYPKYGNSYDETVDNYRNPTVDASSSVNDHSSYSPSIKIPLSVIRDTASSVILKQPGEIIYTEGTDADSVYILLSGTAKAVMTALPTFNVTHVSGTPFNPVRTTNKASFFPTVPLSTYNRSTLLCPDCRNETSTTCSHPHHTVPSSSPSGSSSSSSSFIRIIGPGCVAGAQAVFVGMPYRETLIATTAVQIAVFTRTTFTTFAESDIGYREFFSPFSSSTAVSSSTVTSPPRPSASASSSFSTATTIVSPSAPFPKRPRYDRAYALGEITLAVSRSLVPILHMFLRLGLVRLWLKSGEVLFRAGDTTDGLYVVISGRLRTYRGGPHHPSSHHHPSSVPTTAVHRSIDTEENNENENTEDDDEEEEEDNRDPDYLHGNWGRMSIPSHIVNPSSYVAQGVSHPSHSRSHSSMRPTKLSSYLSLDIDSAHHAGHDDDIEKARNPAGGLLGEFIDVDKAANADYQVGIRRNESAALSPISPNDHRTDETNTSYPRSLPETGVTNPLIHRKWTNNLTINPTAPVASSTVSSTLVPPKDGVSATKTTTIISPKPSPLLSMTSTVDSNGDTKEPLFETLPENVSILPSTAFTHPAPSPSVPSHYPQSSPVQTNNRNTSFFSGHTNGASEMIRVDASRGETVGELSVLTCAPYRSNTAVCFRDCELVKLSPAAFDLIATKYPFVMTQFVRVLARKYEDTLAKGGNTGNPYGLSSSSSSSSSASMDTNWSMNNTAATLATTILAHYLHHHQSLNSNPSSLSSSSSNLSSSVPLPSNLSAWPYFPSMLRDPMNTHTNFHTLHHISSSLMTSSVLSPRMVSDSHRSPPPLSTMEKGNTGTEPTVGNPEAIAATVAASAAAAVPYLLSPTNAAFTLPSPNGQRFVTIAVVPAGGNPIGVSDFTVRLVNALNRMNEGSVLHLNSASLNTYFGSGTKERLSQLFVRAKVASWLSAQEEKYRFIVFEADPDEEDTIISTNNAMPLHHYDYPPSSSSRAYVSSTGNTFTPWEVSQRVTQHMLQGVRDAGTSLEAGVRSIGRGLDTAVLSRLGISPSTFLHRHHPSASSSRRSSFVYGPHTHRGNYSRDPLTTTTTTPPIPHVDPSTATGTAAGVTAWNKLCVQQADLCLLVGQAHTSPSLSSIESSIVYKTVKNRTTGTTAKGITANDSRTVVTPTTKLVMSRTACRKELVLLHYDPTRRPQGTRAWLRERRVAVHHHVRTWIRRRKSTTVGTIPVEVWNSASQSSNSSSSTTAALPSPAGDDYDRLARHICGKSRGLVLSGGGSRGLGHLGVFTELDQRGIDIDVIGGTSQGAFMAACYALTLNYAACVPMAQKLATSIGSTWNLVTSLTLPILSYFSGHALNEILIDIFGDVQIEDTFIRYFCVTTNVTDACMSVHVTGPLWRYVRASMTIMGLLPPVIAHHRLLIDGGYSNNLPLDVLRSIAPQVGTVICVDVENKDNSLFEGIDDPGDSISGWYIAYKWILAKLRFSEPLRIPPLSEISLKISYIAHSMQIRDVLAKADERIIYIRPDVGSKYGLLEYHKMDAIVHAGKDAAQRILDARTQRSIARITRQVRRYVKWTVLQQLRQETEQ